jgi:CRISPR-associated exonuclease Cas4
MIGWQRAEAPLVGRHYGLVGRPDYVVRRGRRLIPVEVKPGRHAAQPYQSDMMQLAAYCLLIEETTGQRPPYGILRYAEATFHIPFDRRLRAGLLELLVEMRVAAANQADRRSHTQVARCRSCGFFEQCDQAL